VVGVFADRRFPKRAHGGAWGGELRWGRLTHSRAVDVLSNPVYAGAYTFGRYSSRRAVLPNGTITTKTVAVPRADWPVLIHDHHPAYISWDTFLANERRLAANTTARGQRPRARGTRAVPGDRALRLLRAIDGHDLPAQRHPALHVRERALTTSSPLTAARSPPPASTSSSLRGCSPRSRPRRSRSPSPPPKKSQSAARAQAARSSSASSAASMKRRVPSAHSTPATPRTASSRAASRHAGRPSSASSQEPKRSSPSTPSPPRSPRASRSRRSRPTCPHTGRGQPFDQDAVGHIRRRHNLPSPPETPLAPDEITPRQLAQRLGVSNAAVYYWIRYEQLDARRTERGQLCIPFGPEVEHDLRERIARSAHTNTTTQNTPTREAL
jgi:hypothetical protein